MKKLFFPAIMIFFISNIIAQEVDKLYIEIVGEFIPITGIIEKIEKADKITVLSINVKNKKSHVVFSDSELNESFFSYIKTGDMINLKVTDCEKKIAIFKKQVNSVQVKIFYVK